MDVEVAGRRLSVLVRGRDRDLVGPDIGAVVFRLFFGRAVDGDALSEEVLRRDVGHDLLDAQGIVDIDVYLRRLAVMDLVSLDDTIEVEGHGLLPIAPVDGLRDGRVTCQGDGIDHDEIAVDGDLEVIVVEARIVGEVNSGAGAVDDDGGILLEVGELPHEVRRVDADVPVGSDIGSRDHVGGRSEAVVGRVLDGLVPERLDGAVLESARLRIEERVFTAVVAVPVLKVGKVSHREGPHRPLHRRPCRLRGRVSARPCRQKRKESESQRAYFPDFSHFCFSFENRLPKLPFWISLISPPFGKSFEIYLDWLDVLKEGKNLFQILPLAWFLIP